MAHSKRVQALLRRLSCIPLVNRFRHDDDGEGARENSGEGAVGGSSSNADNNNSTPAKRVPKPGKKPKKQKSFSEIDKGSKKGQSNLVYRCGLTVRQVFSIKQSWKAIQRQETEFGVEMFMRLFKTNSDLQALFQGFKHIRSDDELRSNEALEYHATLVMTTLDDAITHIDNYEFVRQLLHKAGGSHIKFEGFQPDNFLQIKEPFLEAVRVTLGDRYTDNMQTIYTIAITFILSTLVEGIKEAMDAAGIKPNTSGPGLS